MTRLELATLTLGRSCPTIGPHPRVTRIIAGANRKWDRGNGNKEKGNWEKNGFRSLFLIPFSLFPVPNP